MIHRRILSEGQALNALLQEYVLRRLNHSYVMYMSLNDMITHSGRNRALCTQRSMQAPTRE